MTPEIIIGSGIVLLIGAWIAYKKLFSSKFKWTKQAENHYTVERKGHDATIVIDDNGQVTMNSYRNGTPLFKVNYCPSVKWAKDKAEQVIEEDEKKQEKKFNKEHWDD